MDLSKKMMLKKRIYVPVLEINFFTGRKTFIGYTLISDES